MSKLMIKSITTTILFTLMMVLDMITHLMFWD